MPDFFFVKVFEQESAAFIFIDTNLLNYGYDGDEEGKRPAMRENFIRLGWTRANHTITVSFFNSRKFIKCRNNYNGFKKH